MFDTVRGSKESKRLHLLVTLTLIAALFTSVFDFSIETANAADGFSRLIPNGGTTSLVPGIEGVDGIQLPEFAEDPRGDAEGAGGTGPSNNPAGPVIDRSKSSGKGSSEGEQGDDKPVKPATLGTSFTGLNFRQQRLANGGNQFSLEPPDQGFCAGNGYLLESVNDVLRVYDTSGNALQGVVDLNTFYGYPAAINRTTGKRGPFVTDPSCIFDQATQRWFEIVLTLDTNPNTGAFLGSNHLDIAVSTTASPLGTWQIYRLPVQDDGTAGTPNHGCSYGPCIGDYPHIAADKNGIYVTTNEYSLIGPEYIASQVYAFSKKALVSGAPTVRVVQFNTVGAVAGNPGFTVIPAISADKYEEDAGGTEYFLSSMAGEEANNTTGKDNRIALWALTNTRSLDSATPALTLKNTIIKVKTYTVPPPSDQKEGPAPLRDCINDSGNTFGPGQGCWALFFNAKPPTEALSKLDSSDSRMQQVYYAKDKLWGALDTGVTVGGKNKAGIAYYIIEPHIKSNGSVSGELARQGQIGLAGNNLTYPTIAVTAKGKGIMSFTLTGHDYYPSAAFVALDEEGGAGDIQIAALGVGPQDGFSGYNSFASSGVARPRWGDYGSAVSVGNDVWFATEYIAQSCTLTQYLTGAIGSCGGTRASLGNWATRITKVTP